VEAKTDFVGQSLANELYGSTPTPRPVLLDLPADTNNPEMRGFIDGDYKLLVYGRDASFELYDLKNDPGEKVNLAKKQPELLGEMKKKYTSAWSALPKVKPYGGQKLTNGATADGPMRPPK
jgi:arylsulfatase A-like enzyme